MMGDEGREIDPVVRQVSFTLSRIAAHEGLITVPHGSVSPMEAKILSILSIRKQEK